MTTTNALPIKEATKLIEVYSRQTGNISTQDPKQECPIPLICAATCDDEACVCRVSTGGKLNHQDKQCAPTLNLKPRVAATDARPQRSSGRTQCFRR